MRNSLFPAIIIAILPIFASAAKLFGEKVRDPGNTWFCKGGDITVLISGLGFVAYVILTGDSSERAFNWAMVYLIASIVILNFVTIAANEEPEALTPLPEKKPMHPMQWIGLSFIGMTIVSVFAIRFVGDEYIMTMLKIAGGSMVLSMVIALRLLIDNLRDNGKVDLAEKIGNTIAMTIAVAIWAWIATATFQGELFGYAVIIYIALVMSWIVAIRQFFYPPPNDPCLPPLENKPPASGSQNLQGVCNE